MQPLSMTFVYVRERNRCRTVLPLKRWVGRYFLREVLQTCIILFYCHFIVAWFYNRVFLICERFAVKADKSS